MTTTATVTRKSVAERKAMGTQKLPFEQWLEQVGQALNSICFEQFTLEDVPQSFNLKERYDRGDDVVVTAERAYAAIG